jgi:hypothetical protein
MAYRQCSTPIHIHIERLVLDGLNIAPGLRGVLQAAVEAELARLLATGGFSAELRSSITLPSLHAGGFQLSQDNDPSHLGAKIAGAVYGRIGNEGQVK